MQHKSQNIFLINLRGQSGNKNNKPRLRYPSAPTYQNLVCVVLFRSLKFDIGGVFCGFFSFLSTITSTFHVQNNKVRHT